MYGECELEENRREESIRGLFIMGSGVGTPVGNLIMIDFRCR